MPRPWLNTEMYVCQQTIGPFWLVCEEDGTILHTFRSKSAATRWKRDMLAAIRRDEESETAFLQPIFGLT